MNWCQSMIASIESEISSDNIQHKAKTKFTVQKLKINCTLVCSKISAV